MVHILFFVLLKWFLGVKKKKIISSKGEKVGLLRNGIKKETFVFLGGARRVATVDFDNNNTVFKSFSKDFCWVFCSSRRRRRQLLFFEQQQQHRARASSVLSVPLNGQKDRS